MYDRADLGTLHPRMKKPLGRRLAAGLHSTAYNGSGPVIGPVLTGCSVEEGSPWQLRLKFNATLLRGQGVLFNASSTVAKEDTALYVPCLPHTACSTVIIFALWRLHAIGTFVNTIYCRNRCCAIPVIGSLKRVMSTQVRVGERHGIRDRVDG